MRSTWKRENHLPLLFPSAVCCGMRDALSSLQREVGGIGLSQRPVTIPAQCTESSQKISSVVEWHCTVWFSDIYVLWLWFLL